MHIIELKEKLLLLRKLLSRKSFISFYYSFLSRFILYLILISFFSPAYSSAELFQCISPEKDRYFSNTVCPTGTNKEVIITSPKRERDSNNPVKYSHENENIVGEYVNESVEVKEVELELITVQYSLSKGDLNFLNIGVNFLQQYYSQIFDFDDTVRVRMRIIGNFQEYMRFQNEVTGSGFYSGFYSRRLKEGVINGSRKRKNVLATTLHECSHAIIDLTVPYLPLWVNEGLSEYFERMVPYKGKIVIQQQNKRHYDLHRWISSDELVPLRNYLRLNNYSWREKGRSQDEITRTMAWSLVHFMMSTKKGQRSLVKIVQSFANRESNDPVNIVNKSYKGGISRLERDWLKYIQSPPTIHSYDIY